MGIGAMAFSLLCQYVILCANRVASPCLSKITLYIGVAVFLLYVFIIFIKLLLAFRLPIHPRNHIMKKPREIYHRPANRDDGANPAEPYYEEAEGK